MPHGMNKIYPQEVLDFIVAKEFHVSFGTHTTCVVKLKNDQTVSGESVPHRPEDYNQIIGEEAAFQDAVRKVWPQYTCAIKLRYLDREDVDPRPDTD